VVAWLPKKNICIKYKSFKDSNVKNAIFKAFLLLAIMSCQIFQAALRLFYFIFYFNPFGLKTPF